MQLPRIRAGLTIGRRGAETLVFSARPERFDAIDDPDGVWLEVLQAADGTQPASELPATLARRGHLLAQAELESGLAELERAGYVVDASGDRTSAFSNQIAYLEQHARTPSEAVAMNDRVRAAHVVVIGAGGVGSWVTMAVAMLGVAKLTVLDADRVDEMNLTRQPYTHELVGSRKVEALGTIVRGLRPDAHYEGVAARVEQAEDLAVFVHDADLVCCCADEPSPAIVAALVASVCVPRRIPYLTSAYQGAVVRAGPTWTPAAPRAACAGCVAIVRERDFEAYGPSDAEVARARSRRAPGPVTVSQSLLAAAITAEEALNVLAGARPALRNRILTFDQRTLRSHRARIAPQSSCRLCGPHAGRERRVRETTRGGKDT